jgi:preprotein translocase subunit SecA
VRVQTPEDVQAVEEPLPVSNVRYQHADYEQALAAAPDDPPPATAPPPFTRAGQKVGRNDMCPCGSGKKYKHCHGRLA